MNVFITGIAGFIGSSIAERCLAEGHGVSGIDMFTDNYAREIKENNLARLREKGDINFIEEDILKTDAADLLNGTDVVFHEAAIPGVRDSWGSYFEVYVDNNILCSQKLLEAAKTVGVKKFIYASSSSLYGDAESYPTSEKAVPRPMSPYGVSKLAGEHLCLLYFKNFQVPALGLRYFTVYGPKQRPDMAFHKLLKAVHLDTEFPLFGDGSQTRDFTFISDAVDANMACIEKGVPGRAYNIGGGSRVSMIDVFEIVEKVTGRAPRLNKVGKQKGDVKDTAAEISLAQAEIGYSPKVSLEEGIAREWEWIQTIY